MGQLGGGPTVSENCVPHCTQIKFSMAILSSAISDSLGQSIGLRIVDAVGASRFNDWRLTQTPYNSGSLRKCDSQRKGVGNEAGLLAFVAG